MTQLTEASTEMKYIWSALYVHIFIHNYNFASSAQVIFPQFIIAVLNSVKITGLHTGKMKTSKQQKNPLSCSSCPISIASHHLGKHCSSYCQSQKNRVKGSVAAVAFSSTMGDERGSWWVGVHIRGTKMAATAAVPAECGIKIYATTTRHYPVYHSCPRQLFCYTAVAFTLTL